MEAVGGEKKSHTLDWADQKLTCITLEEKLSLLSEDKCYTEVILKGNCLKALPNLTKYKQLHNVKILDLSECRLKEVDPKYLPKSLDELNLSNNELTETGNFFQFKNLSKLHLQWNKIGLLDGSDLPPNLQTLIIYENNISHIIDLNNLTQLSELNLRNNSLPVLDGRQLPHSLSVLNVHNNPISRLYDLTSLTALSQLYIGGDELTHLDIKKMPPGIQHLSICDRASGLSNLASIRSLKLLRTDDPFAWDLQHSLTLSELPHNIEFINAAESKLMYIKMGSLGPNRLTGIVVLDLQRNMIESLPDISALTLLKHLDMSFNRLNNELDADHVPINIEYFSVQHNLIKCVGDFSKHRKLGDLNLLGNPIQEIHPANTDYSGWRMSQPLTKSFTVGIPASPKSELLEFQNTLDIQGKSPSEDYNPLSTDSQKVANRSWTRLDLSGMGLTSDQELCAVPVDILDILFTSSFNRLFPLRSLTPSFAIDMHGRPATTSGFMDEMCESDGDFHTIVDLSSNNFMTLTAIHKLRHTFQAAISCIVNFSQNQLQDLDGCQLPDHIEELQVYHNQINKLQNLTHLQHLQYVYMSHNILTELDGSQLPLGIRVLDVSWNRITRVGDLSKHKELRHLQLEGNKISEIHPANTDFSPWLVSHLDESLFMTREVYKGLISGRFRTVWLQEPPPEVFQDDYQKVLMYFQIKKPANTDDSDDDANENEDTEADSNTKETDLWTELKKSIPKEFQDINKCLRQQNVEWLARSYFSDDDTIKLCYKDGFKSEAELFISDYKQKHQEVSVELEEGEEIQFRAGTVELGSMVRPVTFIDPCKVLQSKGLQNLAEVCQVHDRCGTLTCFAKQDKEIFALTAEHVFSKSKIKEVKEKKHIDQNVVCELQKHTILLSAANDGLLTTKSVTFGKEEMPALVDIAVMKLSQNLTDEHSVNSKMLLGPLEKCGIPRKGDCVYKIGAITGTTFGTITSLKETVNLGYVFTVTGTDKPFSAECDSGALVFLQEGDKPIGILFGYRKSDDMDMCVYLECCLKAMGGGFKLYKKIEINQVQEGSWHSQRDLPLVCTCNNICKKGSQNHKIMCPESG